ncbi:hypothetical protein ACHAXH_005793 [Discostella pseudostelligera]|jgi:hypothetical protein
MMLPIQSAVLLILCMRPMIAVGGSSSNAPSEDKNASSSYTKYQHYPPYCSTPQEMAKRAIPPLNHGTTNDASTQLIHATAIIRHGARTPFMGPPAYQCWADYWTNANTGIWNCNLKTYISPPAASKDSMVVDGSGMILEETPDFLFEKRYDALSIHSPLEDNDDGSVHRRTGNHLNGTCQVGQLLHRGYDQEIQNGLHLRQAYFYDGNKTADEHAASDSRMRLWDLTNKDNSGNSKNNYVGDPTKPIYQEPNLRYRADDEQRTLMSGQILLRGLFEQELLAAENNDETVVIRLHTADYDVDILTPESATCPKTLELYNAAYQSDEYKAWIEKSMEAKTVQSFVKNELGLEEIPPSMLDCLMTTICTDRSLPDSLNDYDGSLGSTPWDEGDRNRGSSMNAITRVGKEYTNIFEQITNFVVKNYTFSYKYNNGAFPKLGMGPLWKEIMTNILPIVDPLNHPPSASSPPPKLALFSGHDTTLMPLLATLGDEVWSGTEWASYASMVIIEIHEILNQDPDFPSGFAFRLIYNGNVLTSKMDGCAEGSELCDSQILVKQVMPFAKYMERDCAASTSPSTVVPVPADDLLTEMEIATHNLLVAPGGVWVIVALVISSMAFGCLLMWCLMRYRMRKYHAYKSENVLGDLSMRAFEEDDHYYHSEQRPGIDSAIPAGYGATVGDEKKLDEDALI